MHKKGHYYSAIFSFGDFFFFGKGERDIDLPSASLDSKKPRTPT